MPIYEYECNVCGLEFSELVKMADGDKMKHCGVLAKKWISIPQVTKSGLYNFTCTAFGKPVDIHSRRQYKQLLKANGAPDATVRECLSVKPKNNTKDKMEKLSKEVKDEIYKKGAMPWCTGKENLNGSDKISEARR